MDEENSYFRAGIKRGQLAEFEQTAIESRFSQHVERVIAGINDGKEATVWLCEGRRGDLLAAKMHRARRFRAFRNNREYTAPARLGRRDQRADRAMQRGTRKGREFGQWEWVEREWQVLHVLYEAGVSVPKPVDTFESGILMEFIGAADGSPSPRLHDVLGSLRHRTDEGLLRRWWEGLIDDVDAMLGEGVIHGDLSPYNVLVQDGRCRIIDVPQAMDAGQSDAFSYLLRDVGNLARSFAGAGLTDVEGREMDVSLALWRRHGFG